MSHEAFVICSREAWHTDTDIVETDQGSPSPQILYLPKVFQIRAALHYSV